MKFFGIAVLLGFTFSSFAGKPESTLPADYEVRNNFRAGERELTAGGMVMFSPWMPLSRRPTINFTGAFAQLGYMLSDADDDGKWSGNFEGLVDGYGASIFKGRGNYMAGTTVWVRYNIMPPSCQLVPYLQGGAGVTLTDVDRHVLGQDFNFNLNVAAGVRYFIKPRCSLNAEYRYQHISNAGMSQQNLGIDAQGGVLSVSWFF